MASLLDPELSSSTILIADNDSGVSTLLRIMLERTGYVCVEHVADGLAALKRLTSKDAPPVQLLVCDLDMPVMSGEELLQQLSGWESRPAVLVVSAYLDPGLEAELRRSSILAGVLAKPFDMTSFIGQVEAALRPDRRAGGGAQDGGGGTRGGGPQDGGPRDGGPRDGGPQDGGPDDDGHPGNGNGNGTGMLF